MPEYSDVDVRELADVLTDARLVHGISAPMSLARWLLDRGYRRVGKRLLTEPERSAAPVEAFPEDPEDCEHGRWNPDNGQCLDCGHISPEDLPPTAGVEASRG